MRPFLATSCLVFLFAAIGNGQGPMPPKSDKVPAKTFRELAQRLTSAVAVDPPPSPTPQPAPNVTPPSPVNPSEPSVPAPRLKLPQSAMIGQLVIDLSESRNCRSFDFDLQPSGDLYFDASKMKLILTVVKPASCTLVVVAASPDGGQSKLKQSIQFVGPAEDTPSLVLTGRVGLNVVSYSDFVRDSVKSVQSQTRREDAYHLADAYDSLATQIEDKSIRSGEEFKRAADRAVTKNLGAVEPAWDTFNTKLGQLFAREGENLDAVKQGCKDVVLRARQFAFYGK
jgi:hypothetical protein